MTTHIGALDQGTTSTRFIVFDRSGAVVSIAQREHEQIYPKAGWVEHDPQEIWRRSAEVITEALAKKGGYAPQNWRTWKLEISVKRRSSGSVGPVGP
jgi:glycerol kinase